MSMCSFMFVDLNMVTISHQIDTHKSPKTMFACMYLLFYFSICITFRKYIHKKLTNQPKIMK